MIDVTLREGRVRENIRKSYHCTFEWLLLEVVAEEYILEADYLCFIAPSYQIFVKNPVLIGLEQQKSAFFYGSTSLSRINFSFLKDAKPFCADFRTLEERFLAYSMPC